MERSASASAAEKTGTVSLIYTDREVHEGEKGLFGSTREAVTKVGELNLLALSENLTTLCEQVGNVVETLRAGSSTFRLDSFEATVEVSASGEVRLVGAVGAEVRGGMKLVFRRSTADPE